MSQEGRTRVVFIGAGNIATQHMRYLKGFPDVEVVGIYDTSDASVNRWKAEFGVESYRSLGRMFEVTEPDATFICLPPYAHGEAEAACIEHHTPFLVEKPLAKDMELARKIHQSVKDSKIFTSVAYMNRYRRGVQEAKRILGKYPASLISGGWVTDTPRNHPWITRKELSGGQLLEQTTHLFDMLRYLAGEVDSVYAYGTGGFVTERDYEIEDATCVVMRMNGGAVASISSSWSSGLKESVYMNFFGPDVNVEFRNWEQDARIAARDMPAPLEIPGDKDIFAIEDRAFIDAVRKNDKSGILSDYEDGVRSLKLSLAANESLRTGKPVSLRDI